MISHKYLIKKHTTYWTVDVLLDSRKLNCQSNEDEK